jgi:hypothetical protein
MVRSKDLALYIVVIVIVAVFMYYFTFTSFGYGNWLFITLNIIFFSLFFLLTQYRKKRTCLPNSVYIAFIVALFAEMYGFPLTMYFFMGCTNSPPSIRWILTDHPWLEHPVAHNHYLPTMACSGIFVL